MSICGLPSSVLDAPSVLDEPKILLDAANDASILSKQQHRAYAKLIKQLHDDQEPSEDVKVGIIGGSVPAGRGCDDPQRGLRGEHCAYSARFATWLRCFHSKRRLELVNHATGGVTTAGALPELPVLLHTIDPADGKKRLVDWLLIDFATNDAAFQSYQYGPEDSWNQWNTRNKPRWNESAAVAESPVAAATEIMLRYLMEEHPRLPILLIESACKATSSTDNHAAIAKHYGVPFLWYAEGLQRKFTTKAASGAVSDCSQVAWHSAGRSKVHPHWGTHASIGGLLSIWWRAFSARFAAKESTHAKQSKVPKPDTGDEPGTTAAAGGAVVPFLTSATARRPFAICKQQLTVYDAREAYAAARKYPTRAEAQVGHRFDVTSSGWDLFEDRPSKPGWITTGGAGSFIVFNLTFGASPRLLLVYEKGYEGWGNVNLYLGHPTSWHGNHGVVLLQGLRTGGHNVTQAELLSLSVGRDTEGGRNNHNIHPHTSWAMKLVFLSAPPLKFKVIHVSSC